MNFHFRATFAQQSTNSKERRHNKMLIMLNKSLLKMDEKINQIPALKSFLFEAEGAVHIFQQNCFLSTQEHQT
jgi:hypothetical protein